MEETWKPELVSVWLQLMAQQSTVVTKATELAQLLTKPGSAAVLPAAVRQAATELREMTDASKLLRREVDEHLVMDLIPALRRTERIQEKAQAEPKNTQDSHTGTATSQVHSQPSLLRSSTKEELRRRSKTPDETAPTPRSTRSSKRKQPASMPPPRAASSRRVAGKTSATEALQFTVDCIVAHRLLGHNKQFLVHWEGYDSSEDTWEDASQLRADAPQLVHAYEQQQEHQRQRAAHSKVTNKAKTGAQQRRGEVRGEDTHAAEDGDVEGQDEDAEELDAYFESEIKSVESDDANDEYFDVETVAEAEP